MRPATFAVSGGIGSLTLACVAANLIPDQHHHVRNPCVDAGLTTPVIWRIAGDLAVAGLAEPAAAPCLPRRVLMGLRIKRRALRIIDRVESRVMPTLPGADVRCRRPEWCASWG